MDELRLMLSTKILDTVEGLPRFRKGTISRLQYQREYQRESSNREFQKREIPIDGSIQLEQIALVLAFEHEDFDNLIRGFKKYFSRNERIDEFVASLQESADSMHAHSWHHLGNITREARTSFPLLEVDKGIPNGVERVSVSFHRILPSVACAVLSFEINPEISNELAEIQNQPYLGDLKFKKFWPLNKIDHAYSGSPSNFNSNKAINDHLDRIRNDIEEWIKKGFRWNQQNTKSMSYIDLYNISGHPDNESQRLKWMLDNKEWLGDYNVKVNAFDAMLGNGYLHSEPDDSPRTHKISNIVVKFNNPNSSNIKYALEAFAVLTTLFSILSKHRNNVENLRSYGFKRLYRKSKLTKSNQQNIQELKTSLTILSRLKQETIESENLLLRSANKAGALTDVYTQQPIDLGKSVFKDLISSLYQIRQTAKIIDDGLTDYISVQNIYVMYKLQRWMFILTIAVTIATIIGVLSGWTNIMLTWNSLKM